MAWSAVNQARRSSRGSEGCYRPDLPIAAGCRGGQLPPITSSQRHFHERFRADPNQGDEAPALVDAAPRLTVAGIWLLP
jgi:hypothetical protein